MSTPRRAVTPWHEVVQLRDDLKTGELALAVFAADLYDVVMQKGLRPVYEDPAEFFALTYPTFNLRELVREVALRLVGRSDKAYRKLAVNYGGGKTHTLIALRHLVHDPAAISALPAVQEFEAHIGFRMPQARVAALCRQDRPGDGRRDAKPGGHRAEAQASLERAGMAARGVRRAAPDPCGRQGRRTGDPARGTAAGKAASRGSIDVGAAR